VCDKIISLLRMAEINNEELADEIKDRKVETIEK
jgi:hypothetical protein